MAKVTVERAQPVERPITGVTLHLSLEEAQVVRALVGSGRGSSISTPRAYANRVWCALADAGIRSLPGWRIKDSVKFEPSEF